VWADLRGVSFTQGFLNAGGIRTRYISSGSPDKPLLLCLHGIGGHAEAYSRNFGAHGERFWMVAIDLLGHGWTDKPPIDYQLPDYAGHVLDVLKALDRTKAHITGESIGGWIAGHLAVHYPRVVDKLVLNTAAGWTAHPDVMARLKSERLVRLLDVIGINRIGVAHHANPGCRFPFKLSLSIFHVVTDTVS